MILVEAASKSFTLHNQGGAVIPVMAGAALSVASGECVGLVGASGAGKSTLMRMIYGIPRAELAPLDAARDVIFNGSR